MNKIYILFVIFLISILSFLILIGCDNHTADKLPVYPEGKGSFSLTLSDSSRTILPVTPALSDFAVYNLNFIPISGGVAISVDRTNITVKAPVFLEVGTYRLVVSAFKDLEKSQLMAQGTAENDIVISAGKNTLVTVTLKALLTGCTGTFCWNISIPSDVLNSARMTITPGSAGGSNQLIMIISSPAAIGEITLNSGIYNLTFNLEKADGKTVVWRELLYVYRNLESVFNYTFTNAHFSDSRYTVTFNYNDEGLTANGLKDILHGDILARPTAPIRNGYAFINWYIDNNTFISPWNFNNLIIESFTLYAKWEALIDRIEIRSPRELSEPERVANALWFSTGETIKLSVIVWLDGTSNQDQPVTWRSSNESVVNVSSDGIITALSTGTSVITARTDSGGRESQLTVRVFNPVFNDRDRFKIQPNEDTGKIKYSYTYDTYDFYHIYLGQVTNIPIFHPDIASTHFMGTAPHSFVYTQENIETVDIRNSVSNSSSFATGVIEENSIARDDGGLTGKEDSHMLWISTEVGVDKGFVAKVSGGYQREWKNFAETNWNDHTSKTDIDSFEETRSFENTVEHATSWAKSTAITRGFELHPNENRPGYYRYSLFAISDVYLSIIRDSSTGMVYYEFLNCVVPNIPGTDRYAWVLEYTDRLPFGKSNNSEFILDFPINLPEPNTSFYTVTFDKNNDDIVFTDANPRTITVCAQTNIRDARPPSPTIGISKMPTVPQRSGFTFIGWNTESVGSGTAFNGNTPVTANITVFAQWVHIPTFLITVIANPVNGGSVDPTSSNIAEGGRLHIYAIPSSPHFRFVNWTRESGGTVIFDNANSANTVVTLTSGQTATIAANFERIQRLLTVQKEPADIGNITIDGTLISNLSSTINIPSGEQIPISVASSPHFTFSNWSVVSGMVDFVHTSDNTRKTVTLSSDAVIKAHFTREEHSLTILQNPIIQNLNNSISINGVSFTPPDSQKLPSGIKVDIVAVTPITIKNGDSEISYRFVNWEVVNGGAVFDSKTTANTEVTLSSTATIRANFVQTFTLTVDRRRISSGTLKDTNASCAVKISTLDGEIVNDKGILEADKWFNIDVDDDRGSYKFAYWMVNKGVVEIDNAYARSTKVKLGANAIISANFFEGDTFTDPRDGKSYRTVKIGGKEWMAENLKYAGHTSATITTFNNNSWCYQGKTENCVKYGRLYNHYVRGEMCPPEWGLPGRDQWNSLIDLAGGEKQASYYLKTMSDWYSSGNVSGNGVDKFGFSALPGGQRTLEDRFENIGKNADFWLSTRVDSDGAYSRRMVWDNNTLSKDTKNYRDRGFSVRCIRN